MSRRREPAPGRQPPPSPPATRALARLPLFAALLLAGLALRPQVVGVGPLLADIQSDLALSHATAGLLVTIPLLCMGVFAPLAPIAIARVGSTLAVALGLALIGVFGLLRLLVADGAAVLALTVGIGLGMGIGGGVLPVIIKERLSGEPIVATASYSSGMQLGGAAAAALAAPIAIALGGWRFPLGAFSAVTLGLVVVWVATTGPSRHPEPVPVDASGEALRQRSAWVLAGVFGLLGVVYFGFSAWLVGAYVERGWSAVAAGGLVGILHAAALAGGLSVPLVVDRLVGRRRALIVMAVVYSVGALGFIVAPALAVVWALVAGYANGVLFPLILALPVTLVRQPALVAGLSSVMFGAGYTITALSPVGLGFVRDVSGSFQAVLALIALAAIVMAFVLARVVQHWRDDVVPAGD